MHRTAALLRRYGTTLMLVCIAILATIAVAQTIRLRYLEDRHTRMFSEFGKARMDLQVRIGELAQRCPAPAR